jgi:hypothetical protein
MRCVCSRRRAWFGSGLVSVALLAATSVLARPTGDYVPRSARILRVTWESPKRQSIVITDPRQISRIANVINNLERADSNIVCTEGVNFGPPSIWFTFRGRRGGPKLAETFGWDSTMFPDAGCVLMRYSVRNHRPEFLIGGGYLIMKAEKILGRRLH